VRLGRDPGTSEVPLTFEDGHVLIVRAHGVEDVERRRVAAEIRAVLAAVGIKVQS
jgi:hypothetical protein